MFLNLNFFISMMAVVWYIQKKKKKDPADIRKRLAGRGLSSRYLFFDSIWPTHYHTRFFLSELILKRHILTGSLRSYSAWGYAGFVSQGSDDSECPRARYAAHTQVTPLVFDKLFTGVEDVWRLTTHRKHVSILCNLPIFIMMAVWHM